VTRDASSRDPVPLRDAITTVGKQLGLPEPNALAELENAWRDVVGAQLAAHARVRSVRDGEAVIEVDGPAWATQVRYLAREVLEGLDERLGSRAITGFRVVVKGPRKAR
jgi:predicted nucleic acid-binding Zn ribbon protein